MRPGRMRRRTAPRRRTSQRSTSSPTRAVLTVCPNLAITQVSRAPTSTPMDTPTWRLAHSRGCACSRGTVARATRVTGGASRRSPTQDTRPSSPSPQISTATGTQICCSLRAGGYTSVSTLATGASESACHSLNCPQLAATRGVLQSIGMAMATWISACRVSRAKVFGCSRIRPAEPRFIRSERRSCCRKFRLSTLADPVNLPLMRSHLVHGVWLAIALVAFALGAVWSGGAREAILRKHVSGELDPGSRSISSLSPLPGQLAGDRSGGERQRARSRRSERNPQTP